MPPDPLAALLVAALEDRERWRLLCEAQRAVTREAVAAARRLNAECARRAAENAALRAALKQIAKPALGGKAQQQIARAALAIDAESDR